MKSEEGGHSATEAVSRDGDNAWSYTFNFLGYLAQKGLEHAEEAVMHTTLTEIRPREFERSKLVICIDT
jgi:hypothetical protein